MNSVKYKIDVGKMSRKEAEKLIRNIETNLKRIFKIKKIFKYEL